MPAHGTESSLEREGTHALLTTGISGLLGLLLSVVISRTLGPSGKGLLDLTSSTIALFTLVLSGSLSAGLAHFTARGQALPKALFLHLSLWAIGAGALTFLALAFRPDFAARIGLLPPGEPWFWIGFIALSAGCGIWALGFRGVLVGQRATIQVNRVDLLVKAGLFASYLVLLFGSRTPQAFALAGMGAAIVQPLLCYFLLRAPNGNAAGFWPALLATALPLHGTNLLHFINQRADVFFVQAWHGSHEVGLYALAVSLTQLILLSAAAVAQPLLSQISAATSPDEAAATAARTCRLYVAVATMAGAAIALLSFWVIPAIFGRDFSGSLPPLLMLLPGVIAFGLTHLLISYFVGIGRATTNLWISIAVLAVTLIGNIWVTRRLGAFGAALTSTCAYGLAGVLSLICFARASQSSAFSALRPTLADWRDAFTLVSRFRL